MTNPEAHIVVNDEQAKIISESPDSIEIHDRSGKHLGYVAHGFSDEDIASPVIERPGVVIALNGPSLAKFEDRLRPGGLLIWNSSLVKNPPTRKDLVLVPIEATALSLAEGTERGANMAAIGALLELKPDLVGLVAVEEALDEVISARNKKHNPVNIRILHAGQSAVGGNAA